MAEIDDLNVTDASNTGRFPEGMAPSAVNDAARALEGILARAFSDTIDSDLRGTLTSSTYQVTTNRSISAYDGLMIAFRANAANTVGAVDLQINGHSAHNMLRPSGIELQAGDIQADQWVMAVFKGTASAWQVVSGVNPESSLGAGLAAHSTTASVLTALGLSTIAQTFITQSTTASQQAVLDLEIGVNVQAYDADTLKADTADTLTAGFDVTDHNAGTKSSGTYTPDPADGNFQYAVNGGAHTLAPPATSCTMVVQYTNNASAGAITTSGWTKVDGSFDTTDGNDFVCYLTRINSFTHLNIVALQ